MLRLNGVQSDSANHGIPVPTMCLCVCKGFWISVGIRLDIRLSSVLRHVRVCPTSRACTQIEISFTNDANKTDNT